MSRWSEPLTGVERRKDRPVRQMNDGSWQATNAEGWKIVSTRAGDTRKRGSPPRRGRTGGFIQAGENSITALDRGPPTDPDGRRHVVTL